MSNKVPPPSSDSPNGSESEISSEINVPPGSELPKGPLDFEQRKKFAIQLPLGVKLALTGLAVFLATVGYFKSTITQTEQPNEPKETEPDQSLTEDRGPVIEGAFKTSDGKDVTLAQFRGKVTIVTFWASWCAPCLVELPTFSDLYRQYKEQGFEIIAVNLDEEETAKDFIKDFWNPEKLPFKNYFDPERKLVGLFHVETIPSTFVLDRRGHIALSAIGANEWSNPKSMATIEEFLKEKN